MLGRTFHSCCQLAACNLCPFGHIGTHVPGMDRPGSIGREALKLIDYDFFRFDFYFFENLSCPQNVTAKK
jgi:hypothetical protein